MNPPPALTVTSWYSFFEGVHSPRSLVEYAVSSGSRYLLLEEKEGLYSLPEFLECAIGSGIRILIGVNLAGTLYVARSERGLTRLFELVSGHRMGDKRINLPETIARIGGDVAVVTDSLEICRDFPESYYRVREADIRTIPDAISGRVLYLPKCTPLDLTGCERYKYLGLINRHGVLGRDEEYVRPGGTFDMERYTRVLENYPFLRRSLERFVESVYFSVKYPRRPLLEQVSDETIREFREEVYHGARSRYGVLGRDVRVRLERELKVIIARKFVSLFLICREIRKMGSLCCGRGSAAASLISYCLGITDVDPIKYDLLFERFLHEEREDPPDIDLDFPWDERRDILRKMVSRFGEERVALVSNHNFFRQRAAFREAGRILGLSDREISRYIEAARRCGARGSSDPIIRRVFRVAEVITGVPRGLSTHCGGVVITPGPVRMVAPLERKMHEAPLIQWEKDGCERMGLVKIDILGNRSLSVIRDTLETIRLTDQVVPDFREQRPEEDPETQRMFARGDTMGIFYVESPAMRQLQRKTGKGDYEHLVIHSSLIRPAARRWINEYIERVRGEKTGSIHPLLDKVLGETYGVPCYQEDVLRLAGELGGFSQKESDDLRRTLSHKGGGELEIYRERFIQGARRHGLTGEQCELVWDMIASFGGYSFCKPHSASYARVSFEAGYLKRHYPVEFFAAVLSNYGGYYNTAAYVSEARRRGIRILRPDVNTSAVCATVERGSLRLGFGFIRGLSRRAREVLVSDRPSGGYSDCQEFFRRMLLTGNLSFMDCERLIRAGIFDRFTGDSGRNRVYWALLAAVRGSFPSQLPSTRFLPPTSPERTMLDDLISFGFTVTDHVAAVARRVIGARDIVRCAELKKFTGKKIKVLGVLVTGRNIWTRQGEKMGFYGFEDETALVEVTVFPGRFRRFYREIRDDTVFILFGRVCEEYGDVGLVLEKATPVYPFRSLLNRLIRMSVSGAEQV